MRLHICRRMNISRGILRIITCGMAIGFMMAAAAPAAAATRTWDGGSLVDTNWMTKENWEGDVAPVSGDSLIFPAGATDTVNTNNFPAGTKFVSIVFGGAYQVNGNRILIGSAIEQQSANEAMINCNITLEGGLFSTGVTLTVVQSGELRFSGVIDSSGGPFQSQLRKNGLGRVRLLGDNTYGGQTAIQEGELRIHHGHALGIASPAANTIVSDGGVLGVDIVTVPVVAEPLMLAGQGTAASANDGALTIRQSATLSGAVTLFGASTPIIATLSPTNVEISGAIGGSTGFIKIGGGLLRLSGANTYTGMTTVVEDRLFLMHAQALGSPSSGVTVLSGASLHMDVPEILNEPLFAQTNGSGNDVLYCMGPLVCTWSGPIVVQGKNGFFINAGHTLRLTGDISGVGDISFTTGDGVVELLGNNTYEGTTILGDIELGPGVNHIPDTSYLQFSGTGSLDLKGAQETVGSITGPAAATIELSGGALIIDTPDSWSMFQGVISGSGGGGLVKKGNGTFEIRNVQTYTAVTSVQAGVFKLGLNAVLPGPVNVLGGILRGIGSVGGLTASAGRIEPGMSAGIITTHTLNMGPGATLALELNGPTAGTEHDQVKVTDGAVALGGATLELSSDSVNAFDVPLVIVKNDGAAPVTGTFAGLPEGAFVFPANGRGLRITYAGGDGNDIVVTPETPTYYLAEGATGPFFDLDILIANPTTVSGLVELTFLLPDGTTKKSTRAIPAQSRVTVDVEEIDGVEATSVSTIVTSLSGLPLVVERTMRWNSDGYGAHTEKAVSSTAKDWYFAEGSQGFFSTYLLLANPQPSPNVATVRYLRENAPAIVRTYPVDANSRYTVDAGADADLVGSSFGMHVTFEQPGVAERSMYFGSDPFWKAGHESAGVTAPSPTWFLAEGATGPFFETFVLLANPGDQPAEATVTFLPDTGVPVVKTVPIPALGRVTLNIEGEDSSLANAAVATQVSATQPILVERAQYWPDPAPQWYEAHNSFGVTAVATKWGLAEGRSGGAQAYQTYILLANPGAVKANVTVTFLREGQTPVEKTYEVNPQSRFNVDTGAVPELADLSFGAVITSDQPIAVERAMYNNANGQIWAAGTNATATPLP
jgi:autotransporter-associated beta strand protein